MSYLLDSNVLSQVRKARSDPGVVQWFGSVLSDQLHVSVLTIGELRQWQVRLAARGDEAQATSVAGWLDELVDALGDRVLPVDARVARVWGMRAPAQPRPVIDSLLAATAIVHGLTIVTRNTKDFKGTGVSLVNPFRG